MNKIKCLLILAVASLLTTGCDGNPDETTTADGKPASTTDGTPAPATDTSTPLQVGSACEITYDPMGYSDPCVAANAGYCVPHNDAVFNTGYQTNPLLTNDVTYYQPNDRVKQTLQGFCRSDCHFNVKVNAGPTLKDVETQIDQFCGPGGPSIKSVCHLHIVTNPSATKLNIMPSCSDVDDPIYECIDSTYVNEKEMVGGRYIAIGTTCSNTVACQIGHENCIAPTTCQPSANPSLTSSPSCR
jgi:hypothetical protein